MITLQYKGRNYLLFGKVRISSGNNEVSEEDFYELLKYKSFKIRVERGDIKLPQGMSVEKFTSKKSMRDALKEQEEKRAKDEKEDESQEEDESPSGDKLSVKQTLKNIQKSEDVDYLKDLSESDDRERVKEAALKRIEALQAEEKK